MSRSCRADISGTGEDRIELQVGVQKRLPEHRMSAASTAFQQLVKHVSSAKVLYMMRVRR
jgi:hypothetical protein